MQEIFTMNHQQLFIYPIWDNGNFPLVSLFLYTFDQKIADTKSLLAFEGFVLDGLSFDEIVEENPGFFSDERDARSKS